MVEFKKYLHGKSVAGSSLSLSSGLGGETHTSCSYGVCSFVNGSAHCSGCVVYGLSAMGAT